MKLLFDANLSPKLASRFAELFPGSMHVFDSGLARFASDHQIWDHARQHGFAIVTADRDFLDLSAKFGCPPKVIRIERCVFRTMVIEDLLRKNAVKLVEFGRDGRAVLVIRPTVRKRN